MTNISIIRAFSCAMILATASACHTQKQSVQVQTSSGMHFQSTSVCERGTLTVIKPHVQLPDVLTSSMVKETPRETLKIVYASYRDSIVYDTIQVEYEAETTTEVNKSPPHNNVNLLCLIVTIIPALCLSIYLFFGRFFGKK